MKVLREYEENGYKITEFSSDGETVSHTMQVALGEGVVTEDPFAEEEEVSLIDIQTQILLNTEYLVALSELNAMEGE